jgi:hypothetical protein
MTTTTAAVALPGQHIPLGDNAINATTKEEKLK